MDRIVEMKTFPAIRLIQAPEKPLYLAAIDAKTIREQSNIDRMSFNETTNRFEGYQRRINAGHKRMILDYLRSGMSQCGALMTDAITIAVREEVQDSEGNTYSPSFSTSEETSSVNQGILSLPFIYNQEGREKTDLKDDPNSLLWIVDGQHRLEAFHDFDYPGVFPLAFSFYFSSDVDFNREVFIRTNIRLPISQDVLLRDLARVSGPISRRHEIQQLIGQIANKLEFDITGSPFIDKIRRPGISNPRTKITLSVFYKIIRISITEDSTLKVLWRRSSPLSTPENQINQIGRYLVKYWSAVKESFSDYWDMPNTEQRLSHSIGLYTLAGLMDAVMSEIQDWTANDVHDQIMARLTKLTRIPWDGPVVLTLQNNAGHRRALFDALHDYYVSEDEMNEIELNFDLGDQNPRIVLE